MKEDLYSITPEQMFYLERAKRALTESPFEVWLNRFVFTFIGLVSVVVSIYKLTH
jgi:hypothetical protein